jgi:hypothetical protein
MRGNSLAGITFQIENLADAASFDQKKSTVYLVFTTS